MKNFDLYVVALIFLAFGFAAGGLAVDSNWRNDCDKIKAHLSGQLVYKCEVKQGD